MTRHVQAFGLVQHAPGPAGQGLAVTIECTNSPTERFGIQHRVRIASDWSVNLEAHDVESERIARKIGASWCSCLFFLESVVPAYRETLAVVADPEQTAEYCANWRSMERLGEHRICWWCDLGRDCQADFECTAIAERMRHAMSAEGLASHCSSFEWPGLDLNVAARDQSAALLAAAGRAWSRWGDPDQVEGGEDGFHELWWHGVLPSHVDAIARSMPKEAWPLSTDIYWNAHFGMVDPQWLSSVVACYPEREFVEWAVAQGDRWSRIDPADVWRMYELRVSARDAMGALDAQVPVGTLADVSLRGDISAATAARWLTAWSQLGIMPTSQHFRVLEANRALGNVPSAWRITATIDTLRIQGVREMPSRLDLAVMLAIAGDIPLVVDAVTRGVREATDLRFLNPTDQWRTI